MNGQAAGIPAFPLSLPLRGRLCLLVGGGEVAERKLRTLLPFGPRLRVVAPEIRASLEEMAVGYPASADGREAEPVPGDGCRLELVRREYRTEDLEGVFLAFAAATPEVNARVAADCRRKGILVNVADDPESSDFFLPSHLRRGLLVVAVSTSGASPALARRIRERLEPLFPPAYGPWTERLALARRRVLASFSREEDRRRILERLAEKAAALAAAGRSP